MNIMIIEDEQSNERHLRNILKTVLPDSRIIASTGSIRSSIEFLSGTDIRPDIVFADIQLADGLCFPIFEKVNFNIPVIFTTAYDQYAMNAFECNGVAYILKPVMEKDVRLVMDRLMSLVPLNRNDITELKDSIINRTKSYPKRLIIEHGPDLFPVYVSDIVLIETEFRNTKIFTSDGRWGISKYTLKFFEENLECRNFFKISRREIISMDKILALKKIRHDVYEVVFSPGISEKVFITSDKVKALKRLLPNL